MESGDVFSFGPFFPFFGRQNWPFLRGLTKCQNWGANVRMGVQRGIWFTFLIAALYWMIGVSRFNRDTVYCTSSLKNDSLCIGRG